MKKIILKFARKISDNDISNHLLIAHEEIDISGMIASLSLNKSE